MAKEKIVDVEQLIEDDLNFNLGTERGQQLIDKSFSELGAGRSVLLDKNNRLIAGNKSKRGFMAAGGTKVRIIETDGTELIAVKRTDVDLDSEKGRKMALADNATTQANLAWDEAALQQAREQWDVKPEEWDVTPADAGLPEELAGLDLTPDKLAKELGDDKTEMERVIICYYPHEAELVKNMLGVENIDKVVYNVAELLK